ncbi:uncharacterized protein LOC114070090 [Empidonax traillii]|uniref:uncharacterized protein LOC114070090 n=1 Tax=Empidonax traillii TaxID=164674 RepID=UPI000FFD2F55|nr:uncharacterized protein LOC114070090 [Empidonax traillii]
MMPGGSSIAGGRCRGRGEPTCQEHGAGEGSATSACRSGRGLVQRGGGGWKEVMGSGSGDASTGRHRSKDRVGGCMPAPGGDLGMEQALNDVSSLKSQEGLLVCGEDGDGSTGMVSPALGGCWGVTNWRQGGGWRAQGDPLVIEVVLGDGKELSCVGCLDEGVGAGGVRQWVVVVRGAPPGVVARRPLGKGFAAAVCLGLLPVLGLEGDGSVKSRAGGNGAVRGPGGKRGKEKEFPFLPSFFHFPFPSQNNLGKPGKKADLGKKPTFSLKISTPALLSSLLLLIWEIPPNALGGNWEVCHQLWGKGCKLLLPAQSLVRGEGPSIFQGSLCRGPSVLLG